MWTIELAEDSASITTQGHDSERRSARRRREVNGAVDVCDLLGARFNHAIEKTRTVGLGAGWPFFPF
jgi:hypothetical protein